MKIVVLDGYTENPGDLNWGAFEAIGDVTVFDRTKQDEIKARIGDAEVVITNKTPITREMIAECAGIKYIGLLSTGYNVVDIDAAKERGIPVCNVPAYGTQAVAQFAISLLLEICNNVGHHSKAVHSGKWSACPDFCFWDYPLIELQNKTIGIIGFGRIGRATGKIAKAMGMNVLAYNRSECDEGREIATYVGLDELLQKADVISLHCPLFPQTEGIISKQTIEKMKDGVIIINTSRGPLINEQELADALNSGKVYAAGVDVVSCEPINENNPLLSAKNCFITPHIAWASIECRERIMNIAANNLKAFLNGKIENAVNM